MLFWWIRPLRFLALKVEPEYCVLGVAGKRWLLPGWREPCSWPEEGHAPLNGARAGQEVASHPLVSAHTPLTASHLLSSPLPLQHTHLQGGTVVYAPGNLTHAKDHIGEDDDVTWRHRQTKQKLSLAVRFNNSQGREFIFSSVCWRVSFLKK